MKIRLLLIGLLIMATASTAMAKEAPYLGISGGVAILHDSDVTVAGVGGGTMDFDTGVAFNMNAGVELGGGRLEAEFGYKNADVKAVSAFGNSATVDDSDVLILSYMLNGYIDIKTESAIKPFIGAGVGLLDAEFRSSGFNSDKDKEFGYQFMAGLGFKTDDLVTIDVSYRYQGAPNDFSKNGTSISYNSSNILLGIRANF